MFTFSHKLHIMLGHQQSLLQPFPFDPSMDSDDYIFQFLQVNSPLSNQTYYKLKKKNNKDCSSFIHFHGRKS